MIEKNLVKTFESHRAYLTSLAYRMLGSMNEAEDLVQETYIRYQQQNKAIDKPKAFLSKVLVRLCLDYLKSARVKREEYIGPWLPEPVSEKLEPQETEDLSFAILLTLEYLSPLERAAFLLHDIFGMPFSEIAVILERTETACRKLASRAREQIQTARPRFKPSYEECEKLLKAFLEASIRGDASTLASLLAKDALFYSDGGGKVRAALRPIEGPDRIIRFILSLAEKQQLAILNSQVKITRLNGMLSVCVEVDNVIVQTTSFEFEGNQIQRIYSILNPDKLTHLTTHIEEL